jgi:cation diffusion facilitator CzcD-associated flavoprotein CzcO
MPARLCLKSIWDASSLSDPAGMYTLDHYTQATGTLKQEPLPLSYFLAYAQWFQQQNALEADPSYVRTLIRDGNVFRLDLADGRIVKAGRVVVAVGISSFTRVPDFASNLPSELVSHTQNATEYDRFNGRQVVVLGGGQSGRETSALLHEAGAQVELISRGPIRWHNHVLYNTALRPLLYTSADVGPPGINWLVASPFLFRHFPEVLKSKIHRRAIRPGGAAWLRPRVEGQIRLTENTQIEKAVARGEKLFLKLSDGTTREADFLFLGTGYRTDVRRVGFIDTRLQQQIVAREGYPELSEWFESSVPGLHFVGALAGQTFGPICRFVSGAKHPARRIAQQVAFTM